jgi:hypothetical protein
MKPLSEQLSELSDRAKNAEDFVTAAQAHNREVLDSRRAQLKVSISEGKARVDAGATAAQNKAQAWWDDTRSAIDARFDALRAQHDEHRAEHDLNRAERRAGDAEEDAAYAVEFAISMLDQAEYAIADAVIARADADDLAKQQT